MAAQAIERVVMSVFREGIHLKDALLSGMLHESVVFAEKLDWEGALILRFRASGGQVVASYLGFLAVGGLDCEVGREFVGALL